jgi:cell division protein FtsB
MDSVFTMVVLIVLIGSAAGVINNYLRAQRSAAKAAPGEDALAELDQLRKRVEVLEKIVTDDKYHLNQELNRLDKHA